VAVLSLILDLNLCNKNVILEDEDEDEDEVLAGKVLACNSYILPAHNQFNQIHRSSIHAHYKYRCYLQETYVSLIRHTITSYIDWKVCILYTELRHVFGLGTAHNKTSLHLPQYAVLHSSYFLIPYEV
jgi:hypothetical protein